MVNVRVLTNEGANIRPLGAGMKLVPPVPQFNRPIRHFIEPVSRFVETVFRGAVPGTDSRVAVRGIT